jgi:hypothetical protein
LPLTNLIDPLPEMEVITNKFVSLIQYLFLKFLSSKMFYWSHWMFWKSFKFYIRFPFSSINVSGRTTPIFFIYSSNIFWDFVLYYYNITYHRINLIFILLMYMKLVILEQLIELLSVICWYVDGYIHRECNMQLNHNIIIYLDCLLSLMTLYQLVRFLWVWSSLMIRNYMRNLMLVLQNPKLKEYFSVLPRF